MAINPNIKKKADDIRNKIYGKEVRESLASGLEAISTDVVKTVGRQDDVEEQFQNVIRKAHNADVTSNQAVLISNQAVDVSSEAKDIAQQAENKSDNVQHQFNQVVIEGDSSVESAQARVDEKGISHATLKERIDSSFSEVTSQIDDNMKKTSLKTTENFSTPKSNVFVERPTIISDFVIEGSTDVVNFEGISRTIINLTGEQSGSNSFAINHPEIDGYGGLTDILTPTKLIKNVDKQRVTGMENMWRVLGNHSYTDSVRYVGGVQVDPEATDEQIYTNRPFREESSTLAKGVKFAQHASDTGSNLSIYIPKSELTSETKAGCIEWLEKNEVRVIFPIRHPIEQKLSIDTNKFIIDSDTYTISSTNKADVTLENIVYDDILLPSIYNSMEVIDVTNPPSYTGIKTFIGDGQTDNYDSFKSLAMYLRGKKDVKVIFPHGVYKIDRVGSSNDFINYYRMENIEFYGYGAKIVTKGDYHVDETRTQASVIPFYINSGSNVKIKGFEFDGENYKMSVVPGYNIAERRSHLVSIGWDCDNIFLEDLEINNSPVDGINIGSAGIKEEDNSLDFGNPLEKVLTNVYIKNVNVNNSGRQGLTIGVVQNLYVDNSTFDESGITNNPNYPGISPMAGVDIEPNQIAGNKPEFRAIIKNLNFTDCKFRNNVSQQFTTQFSSETEQLNFINCEFIQIKNPDKKDNIIGTLKTVYQNCKFVNSKVPTFAHGASAEHEEKTYHYNSEFVMKDYTINQYWIGATRSSPLEVVSDKKICVFNGCRFINEKHGSEESQLTFYIWMNNPNLYKFVNCEFLADSRFDDSQYYMRGCTIVNCIFGRHNYLEPTKGAIRLIVDETTVISDVLMTNTSSSVEKRRLDSQTFNESTVQVSGATEYSRINQVSEIII